MSQRDQDETHVLPKCPCVRVKSACVYNSLGVRAYA